MRALGTPKAVCVRFCKRSKSRGGKCVRKRKQNAFPFVFVRQDQKMDAPLCSSQRPMRAGQPARRPAGRPVGAWVGWWVWAAIVFLASWRRSARQAQGNLT